VAHTHDHHAADDARRQPASPQGSERDQSLFPASFVQEGLARKAAARAALCFQIALSDVSSNDDAGDDVAEDLSWPESVLSLGQTPEPVPELV